MYRERTVRGIVTTLVDPTHVGGQPSPPFSGSGSCTLWAETMVLKTLTGRQLRMICGRVLQLSLG